MNSTIASSPRPSTRRLEKMGAEQHTLFESICDEVARSVRTTTDRQSRIDAIRDGAKVRQQLGQTAGHIRLADGSHQVTILRGGSPHRFASDTLDRAIATARAAGHTLAAKAERRHGE